MTVPLKLLFALFIAYLLNFKIKGINLFRTAYYIPSILGGSVAIAVLWQFLFQNEGLVNTIIGLFGVKPVNWLGSPDYALVCNLPSPCMAVWISYGYFPGCIKGRSAGPV